MGLLWNTDCAVGPRCSDADVWLDSEIWLQRSGELASVVNSKAGLATCGSLPSPMRLLCSYRLSSVRTEGLAWDAEQGKQMQAVTEFKQVYCMGAEWME